MKHEQDSASLTTKVILFFVLRTKGHITKTQLVKFLYLADLYAVKWLGKQITDLKWVYYYFGPWEDDIQADLERMDGREINLSNQFSEREIDRSNQQAEIVLIQLGPNAPFEDELKLPESMKLMLDNIRREWAGSGTENIDRLLKYVYDTAPMKDVLSQGCSPEEKRSLDLLKEREKLLNELESY